jgi:hypothetical protein
MNGSPEGAPSPPAAARSILRVHRRPLGRGRRQGTAIRDDQIHRIGRDLDPPGHATTGVADKLVPHGPRPTASLDVRGMKRVGLIGCGAIGRPGHQRHDPGKAHGPPLLASHQASGRGSSRLP